MGDSLCKDMFKCMPAYFQEFYDKWNKDKTTGKKSPGLNKTQQKAT